MTAPPRRFEHPIGARVTPFYWLCHRLITTGIYGVERLTGTRPWGEGDLTGGPLDEALRLELLLEPMLGHDVAREAYGIRPG